MFFIELRDDDVKTGYLVNRDDLPKDIIEKQFADWCLELEKTGHKVFERYYDKNNWFARIVYGADGKRHIRIVSYSRCDNDLKMTAEEICECIHCRDYIEDNVRNIEDVFNLFSPCIIALVIINSANSLCFDQRYVSLENRKWIKKYYNNLPTSVRLSQHIWSVRQQTWESAPMLLNRYLKACSDNMP